MKIEIKDIVMRYGGKEVLNIPALSFNAGVPYGLVGHNGAGKTTLFKCMTNIIATYWGDVLIDGVSVREQNEILLKVGIVLDGMSCYSNRTGWFNIEYFAGLRGAFDREKAVHLAEELQLHDVLDDKVANYSYGMQKKLVLLIALMHTPEVLILDEPFRGLDIETVRWFKDYLKQLIDDGLTLIISSHVQNDLEALCEVVYVIDQGSIIDEINLKAEKEKEMRLLSTTNNQRLAEIMDSLNYPYETEKDNSIKLDIADPHWKLVKEILHQEAIDILELSKVKILESKLN